MGAVCQGRPPKEIAAQEGTELHKGRNAAEKAFFDLAEYLTHESRGANAIQGVNQPERYYLVDRDQPGKPGKYQYGRGRVVANFDFSASLDAQTQARYSVPRIENTTPTASAVQRAATASTSAGFNPNRTQARTGLGRGSIVTGSESKRSSSGVSDCKGPALTTACSKMRSFIRRS